MAVAGTRPQQAALGLSGAVGGHQGAVALTGKAWGTPGIVNLHTGIVNLHRN